MFARSIECFFVTCLNVLERSFSFVRPTVHLWGNSVCLYSYDVTACSVQLSRSDPTLRFVSCWGQSSRIQHCATGNNHVACGKCHTRFARSSPESRNVVGLSLRRRSRRRRSWGEEEGGLEGRGEGRGR